MAGARAKASDRAITSSDTGMSLSSLACCGDSGVANRAPALGLEKGPASARVQAAIAAMASLAVLAGFGTRASTCINSTEGLELWVAGRNATGAGRGFVAACTIPAGEPLEADILMLRKTRASAIDTPPSLSPRGKICTGQTCIAWAKAGPNVSSTTGSATRGTGLWLRGGVALRLELMP
mmetsp:Transcript_94712/g.203389  ORF Transcript_94712/g.203389 Transcript_94712/m.203389 type:complete len:180 (+) Transcript_94712:647-1186(+)